MTRFSVAFALLAGSLPAAAAPPAEGPVDGAPELVVTTATSATACGGMSVAVRQVKRKTAVEPELVAALTMSAPRDLDFSDDHKAQSMQRFSAFMSLSTKTFDTAANVYQRQLAKGGQAAVVAAARLVQLYRRYGELISHIDIPIDVRTGDFAADKTEAFCNALDAAASPLFTKADEAARACRETAAKAKSGAGWWTPVCAAKP